METYLFVSALGMTSLDNFGYLRLGLENFLIILDHDFHDNIAELNIQYGSYGFLLWP